MQRKRQADLTTRELQLQCEGEVPGPANKTQNERDEAAFDIQQAIADGMAQGKKVLKIKRRIESPEPSAAPAGKQIEAGAAQAVPDVIAKLIAAEKAAEEALKAAAEAEQPKSKQAKTDTQDATKGEEAPATEKAPTFAEKKDETLAAEDAGALAVKEAEAPAVEETKEAEKTVEAASKDGEHEAKEGEAVAEGEKKEAPFKIFGSIFGSVPPIESKEGQTPAPAAPSLVGGSSLFGGSSIFGNLAAGAAVGTTPVGAPAGGQDEKEGEEDEESKQVVTRPNSFPGEEDEDLVHCDFNCTLLKCIKTDGKYGFKSQGTGVLRLLQEKGQEKTKSRLLFRQQGTWHVMLNSPANFISLVEKVDSSTYKMIRFSALDSTEADKEPALAMYAAKFFESKVRDEMFDHVVATGAKQKTSQ